jgi:hypothetical protein
VSFSSTGLQWKTSRVPLMAVWAGDCLGGPLDVLLIQLMVIGSSRP